MMSGKFPKDIEDIDFTTTIMQVSRADLYWLLNQLSPLYAEGDDQDHDQEKFDEIADAYGWDV